MVSGTTATFSHLKRNQANSGISYSAEWTDDLNKTIWNTIWDSTTTSATADPNYIRAEYHLATQGWSAIFFRVRVTQP